MVEFVEFLRECGPCLLKGSLIIVPATGYFVYRVWNSRHPWFDGGPLITR